MDFHQIIQTKSRNRSVAKTILLCLDSHDDHNYSAFDVVPKVPEITKQASPIAYTGHCQEVSERERVYAIYWHSVC